MSRRSPPVRPAATDPGAGTREAILDAALVTFTEHTYGGTSMALVADRAGVAVGSIYRHFPSKEALGNAVYLRWKSELRSRFRASVDPAAPVRDAFAQLWQVLTRFVAEHPDAFAFLEHQQHEAYLEADSQAVSDEITALSLDLLHRGQRAGAVRPADPEVLLALAYGAFVGLSKAIRASSAGLKQPVAGPKHPVAASPAARSRAQAAASRAMVDAEAAVWDLLRAPTSP